MSHSDRPKGLAMLEVVEGNGNGSAFPDYIPKNEFEARVLAVLDETIHGMAALRSEQTRLAAQIAANTNHVLEMVNRVGEISKDHQGLLEVLQVAQRDFAEAANVIGMAQREIRALTTSSRSERPTDPEMSKQTGETGE